MTSSEGDGYSAGRKGSPGQRESERSRPKYTVVITLTSHRLNSSKARSSHGGIAVGRIAKRNKRKVCPDDMPYLHLLKSRIGIFLPQKFLIIAVFFLRRSKLLVMSIRAIL